MPSQPSGAKVSEVGSRRRDKLEYVADLLSELQGIAAEQGCDTLLGLLKLSETEALRQAKERY